MKWSSMGMNPFASSDQVVRIFMAASRFALYFCFFMAEQLFSFVFCLFFCSDA